MLSTESTLIDEMKESWGQSFEALNNAQRLWLIYQTALFMFTAHPEHNVDREHDEEVGQLTVRLDELSRYELLSFLEALVAQVKSSRE
ncbi:MAG: hypothetical protein ACR2LR_13750 [Hassallia sp.]